MIQSLGMYYYTAAGICGPLFDIEAVIFIIAFNISGIDSIIGKNSKGGLLFFSAIPLFHLEPSTCQGPIRAETPTRRQPA